MQKAVGLMRTWTDTRVKVGCEMLRVLDGAPMSEHETISE
jgi:hypothetical protein